MKTALQNAIDALPSARRPASVADYRGITTAARFGDSQAELCAMRDGCGVYDLGFRAKISITGSDRVRWLNGMVTNNIRDLATGQGVYAFLLNPQGHILGDMYVYNQGDSLTVDTDWSQVEKIMATFDHYIIMDDVELHEISEQLTAIGLSGPKAREVLKAAALQIPDLQPLQTFTLSCDCECGCVECIVVHGDASGSESYELWLEPAHVNDLWETLLAFGAAPVGSETLEINRILSGVPLYGIDIRERDLPQETEQARALNFNKGCYIGQEIVERIRSRGSVHRAFAGFLSPTMVRIERGAKIFVSGKDSGEVTSAVSLQVNGAAWTVALGYIRREYIAASNTATVEITIAGARAQIVQLPLDEDSFGVGLRSAVDKTGTVVER